jgi:hypothetical protein
LIHSSSGIPFHVVRARSLKMDTPFFIRRNKETRVETLSFAFEDPFKVGEAEWNASVKSRLAQKAKRRKKFAQTLDRKLDRALPVDVVKLITSYWLDNSETFEWILLDNNSLALF